MQKQLAFVGLSSIAVANDGTVYLGGWRLAGDELDPTLWGFSPEGTLVGFEGSQAGYTTPVKSFVALAAEPTGTILNLDSAAHGLNRLAPADSRDVEVVLDANAFAADAELSAFALTHSGDILIIDSLKKGVQVFSATGKPLADWPIIAPEQDRNDYPRLIATDNTVVEIAFGATLQRYTMDGTLLESWRLPDAMACPGAAEDEAYAHRGISGLVIDSQGRRYISDSGCGPAHTGKQIIVLDQHNQRQAAWPIDGPCYPDQLALDANGQIYVLTHTVHGGSIDTVMVFGPDGQLREEWHGLET